MRQLLPLPIRPRSIDQPRVVEVLDTIRFGLPDEDRLGEFYWFSREYPRFYRYHLYHAEYRLSQIFCSYQDHWEQFSEKIGGMGEAGYAMSLGRGETWQIYWNFEALLGAISAALDILARLCGLFYNTDSPMSFNRLCAKQDPSEPIATLRRAKERWVSRMKDYRDCFVHYTPVDSETAIHCVKYNNGWEVRAKLPVNPNVREAIAFRYSRRCELLRYAIHLVKSCQALDKKIGSIMASRYSSGQFPMRVDNLFMRSVRSRAG